MHISRDTLLSATPEAAADLLHEAGRELRGANLKKSSWQLIAGGLRVQRIAGILLARLEAATTREDALRVLRIARKHVRTVKKSTGGARNKALDENPFKVADETAPDRFLDDELLMRWELELDEEIWPRGNYQEWLAEQNQMDAASRARFAGLLPVSVLQEEIDRYAWRRRQAESPNLEDLRSRLDDATYNRLLSLPNLRQMFFLSDAETSYLSEHGLEHMLAYAADPTQPVQAAPICDGYGLVGLGILEDRSGSRTLPFRVDWEAVAAWLGEHLAAPARAETQQAVIAGGYAFFREAPAALAADLLRGCEDWHPAWTNLLGFAYQRVTELLPERELLPQERREGPVHITGMRWERVLDAGTGSLLVLHALRRNIPDLLRPAAVQDRYWNAARRLLMAGCGSLRRMDYPAFNLVCRPTVAMVRLESFRKLVRLATQMISMRYGILQLDWAHYAYWITSMHSIRSPNPLPVGLTGRIALTLERHAIAYLMLKEHVLRDTFQTAPFRLRRKHIERFWEDQESGAGIDPAQVPANFDALREQFGDDALLEALAHALLDHFKDPWVEGEQAQPLKETLLEQLRTIAVTYRLRRPWMPEGDDLYESDLEHTQELTSFVIQQTENRPVELAHALLHDPRQGLPRLAGGHLSFLEQDCRRIIKEIAGVSQQKISGAETRVFACQPITKSAALDRGSLGGDCSSRTVPMRALSPHHTYYGIFENGKQLRGYMTVYEAWAAPLDANGEEEPGELLPVLCLETINVPIKGFDAVQQDLLLIFEAVAKSRGLADGLVLITGLGTWNYSNGEALRASRRARQGTPVRLFPADPAVWNVYEMLSSDARTYVAFETHGSARYFRTHFRLLAPFDPKQEAVEPENLAEAQRIAALPPKRLRVTARSKEGPVGFISELPEILD